MTTATATAKKSAKSNVAKCTFGRGCKNPVVSSRWLHMCDEHLAGAQELLEQQYEEHKYTRQSGWMWGDGAEDN